ncbi:MULTISPECIES: GNAT family N-acetyltransferase [unclassified Leucobacter]|uniref:GNAT family N-acetyltransferase n=1 Tax=unclassified Leucobacter TaxID=2621730 RepID=UPI00165E45CD|nr:GNAT family N-acetyltransferase [Leucobacter sp. CX169]MBC9927673.1 GNAT family N-acetyltransferase [Leucobacter sp. cx-169]MBC9937357.1 GNAT family N-acetyltransferase [Leucobacter sp. cx-87]
MSDIILETERLTLRRPTEADRATVIDACNDPAIVQWVPRIPNPYTGGDFEWFLHTFVADGWDAGTFYTWAIEHEGELVGMVSLDNIGSGQCTLGYWMTPGSRGKGLLMEAVRRAIDYAFATDGLALERIEWHALAGNEASARIAQRAGFRYEGLLRKGEAGRNGRVDGLVAGLLATDERSPQDWQLA